MAYCHVDAASEHDNAKKLYAATPLSGDVYESHTRLSAKGERFLTYAEASRHNMATLVESCLSKGEAAIFAELSNKIADMLYHTMSKQSE